MVGILPEVRRLLKEGEYDKASDAMREYWEKQGFGLNLYVTPDQRVIPMTTLGKVRAFELKIESEKHEFNNYLRSLDLLTGEVTVRFTDQNGEWIRKTVPSFKRNLLYQTVTAPKKVHSTQRLHLFCRHTRIRGGVTSP